MIEACARNSGAWYDAMFRAHGLTGALVDGLWLSHDPAPPYYSNAVTLAPAAVERQMVRLRDLGSELRPPWSVKDSFAELDLSQLGLRPLFDAEWIWREPTAPLPPGRDDVAWQSVTTPGALELWETAWGENGSPAASRVFVPALLANEAVEVLAGYRGDTIVAGCAANRSIDAVGFSNYFATDDDEGVAADAVGEVARFGEGLPVVGFEAGDALARALRLGFRAAGALRVWATVDRRGPDGLTDERR
jgi:hypothetical protein